MEQAPKHTRRADFVGTWWNLLGPGGVLVTVFSALFGFFEPIAQYGLAAVVLAGFACAGTAILILSAGMIAWRFFKPLPQARTETSAQTTEPRIELTQEKIGSLIEARLDEFLATKLRAEFVTIRQSHAYDKKLADFAGKARDARLAGDTSTELIDQRFKSVATDISALHEKGASLERMMKERHDYWLRTLDVKMEQVDAGFAAIQNRERHRQMFAELSERYEEIENPILKGSGLANGDDWMALVRNWISDLNHWLDVVEHYAMGVREKVHEIPEYVFDQTCQFDEAPLTASQVRRYKQIASLWENAKRQKNRIDKQLRYAAFHSPSKRPTNGPPPRPPEVL